MDVDIIGLVLALPLPGDVTMNKHLNLAEPQFSYLQTGQSFLGVSMP